MDNNQNGLTQLGPWGATIARLTQERDEARAANAALVEATEYTDSGGNVSCILCGFWQDRGHAMYCAVTTRGVSGAALLAELEYQRSLAENALAAALKQRDELAALRRARDELLAEVSLLSVPARLYDSEINCRLETFWDGGFSWKFGDAVNGWQADGCAFAYTDALAELLKAATAAYPNCEALASAPKRCICDDWPSNYEGAREHCPEHGRNAVSS